MIYGNLNILLGLPLLALSVSGVSIHLIKIINLNFRLNRMKKRSKAKWVGEFTLIEGLNLVTNQNIYLILTRRDDLHFKAEQNEFSVNVDEINGIFITKGNNILKLKDDNIRNFLNNESDIPDFTNIRNLIQNNRHYAKKYVMIISLNLNNGTNHNLRMNQDLIIMVLMHGNNSFKQFMKRPEIRSKVRYYNKRMDSIRSKEEESIDQFS